MTRKELMQELKARGISYKATMKTTELEALLNKEEKTMKTQETTKKASTLNLEVIAEEVAQQVEGAYVIPVKPNGFGVKVGKKRAFAIYVTRNDSLRIKSNKKEHIQALLDKYALPATVKHTADGRDVLVEFKSIKQATAETFLTRLAGQDFSKNRKSN